MTEHRTIAIGAALAWEIAAVRRALTTRRAAPTTIGDLDAASLGSTEIVLYRTGIGPKAAARATRQLFASVRPDAIINTGCAGALLDELAPGCTVIATSLVGPHPEVTSWPVAADLQRDVVVALGSGSRNGIVATCRKPLLTPAAKRSHGRATGAAAVEMEGAAVARIASEYAIPCASVRTILDPVSSDLTRLQEILAQRDGRFRRIARNPMVWPTLLQLANQRRKAAQSLRRSFDLLFAHWP